MFSRRIRHWCPLAGAALLLGAPTLAAPPTSPKSRGNLSTDPLGEDAELSRATGLYDTGQYEACVDAFDELLSRTGARRLKAPAKVETARTYLGACLIGVGRTTDAERIFREAILDNPQMKAPDGLLFPEAVVELFLRVHESMIEEIRRAEQKRMQDAEARASREQALREEERRRVEQLVTIAQKEYVIQTHSRWIASIPFGVGQFQNGNSGLGWLFLLSETAASGLLIGSLYAQEYYQSEAAERSKTMEQRNAGIDSSITLQTIGGYGLLGIGVLGIIEAHWSFVPEVRIERIRRLPDHLKIPSRNATNQLLDPSLKLRPWATHDGFGAYVGARF